MFTSSATSIEGTFDSDASEFRVYYTNGLNSNTSSEGSSSKQQLADNFCKRDRSVTFARPLVSNVLEFSQASSNINQQYSAPIPSPILAGHPPAWQQNGPAVCRICYSTENSGPKTGEPLISPCHCKGTMGLYHRTCLSKWLAASNKSCCEICQFRFQIKRVQRPFLDYLRDEDARSARRSLLLDFLCMLLITPLVALSSTVCMLSASHLINEDNINKTSSTYGISGELRFEIAIGLLFLSAVLITAFFVWLGVTITFHRRALKSWQATHWDYKVIDQLSMEESLLINGFDDAA